MKNVFISTLLLAKVVPVLESPQKNKLYSGNMNKNHQPRTDGLNSHS